MEFLAERVRTLLQASPYHFAYDEVDAAMASGWGNSLIDLQERIAALRAVRHEPDFLSIIDSAKRIANITGEGSTGTVKSSLFHDPAEKRLGDLADLVGQQIDELVGQRHYANALESFAGMAPELENFFQQVMVMVDDEDLRENRRALLRKVGDSVRKIADVTRIVVDRSEYSSRG
jgi:glycyl-tRNA synthetase beta chain